MQKITQAIAPGRRVWIVLLSTATFVLTACGGDEESGSAVLGSTSSSISGTIVRPPGNNGSNSHGSGSSTGTSSPTGNTGSGGSGTATGSSVSSSAKSVTLNWQAPTQNSNGSTLTNLAGFKIHYGTASRDYSQVVALDNPGLNRYVVDSLPRGTYYFAITAYNTQGVESAMSGEVETTVD
jgi:hypothetical protein